MSNIIKSALKGAVKLLIGSDYWHEVKNTVTELGNAELTGEEKRALVITTLKDGGWTLGSILLNLAIEVAVLVLSDKLAKEGI